MPFPAAKRVIYKKNPLHKVVCQFRFPTILKIDAESPVDFQEEIRKVFSGYKVNEEEQIQLVQKQAVPSISQGLMNFPVSKSKNHYFYTEDKKCVVNLTKTFIALTTYQYERWEKFEEKIKFILEKFNKIYIPSYYTRVGLRYFDIIDKEVLGLKDKPWNELLQPYIIGALANDSNIDESSIINNEYQCDIKLNDDGGTVHLLTTFVIDVQSNVPSFLIDSDFYNTKRKSFSEVFDSLKFLNSRASRLLQWAIKEELHNKMEPSEIK